MFKGILFQDFLTGESNSIFIIKIKVYHWLTVMATSPVGDTASPEEIKLMISELEKIGSVLLPLDLKTIFNTLSEEVILSKERLSRFLLLVAILDQQAESPTARKTALKIYEMFGNDLFETPKKVLLDLDRLESIKGEYKISPAIGRVLPRFGWFVLRVGGFLIYELILDRKNLSEELGKCESPKEALNFLYSSPLLRSILREKAARMYLSWVGHPDLGIDISNGRWDRKSFEMPVNGHVGKVFSRTGMVSRVIHERKKGTDPRWNIIVASKMRPLIQEIANKYSEDPIMLDHGAFRLGFNCCTDNIKKISCETCPRVDECEIKEEIDCKGRCLLANYCKRNLVWRAY